MLDAAPAKGLRTGENPARWRGHLDRLLPKRDKLSRGHHAALLSDDLPAFMARLRGRPAMAARALEFTILTTARSGETLDARWGDLDLDSAVWTVPAMRMKAKRLHRVPLTPIAAELFHALKPLRGEGDYVFPGQLRGRPLSIMAKDIVLRRMCADVTVHGFRSSFRDWAADQTDHPREVADAASSVIYTRENRVLALDCVNAAKDYVGGRALVVAGGTVEGMRAGVIIRHTITEAGRPAQPDHRTRAPQVSSRVPQTSA